MKEALQTIWGVFVIAVFVASAVLRYENRSREQQFQPRTYDTELPQLTPLRAPLIPPTLPAFPDLPERHRSWREVREQRERVEVAPMPREVKAKAPMPREAKRP